MSRNFPAGQCEQAFISHRLTNWETPDETKAMKVTARTRYSTLRARSGKTEFIVDDKGYILQGRAACI